LNPALVIFSETYHNNRLARLSPQAVIRVAKDAKAAKGVLRVAKDAEDAKGTINKNKNQGREDNAK
jgi:hypothetical protein